MSTKSSYISIIDAACELGVDKRFIRRRIADGTLAAYRLKGSRTIRIRRLDVEALVVPVEINR